MKQLHFLRCLIAVAAVCGGVGLTDRLLADGDAPSTQPSTRPVDTAAVKEVRDQMLAWDADIAKMSLEEFRKTFHTENDREAQYADFLAHDTWECGKTELAVRDKWGADADQQFSRLVGFTTIDEDRVCDIKVDGDHAIASWTIKDMKPEKLIKINGHWQSDVHAMWDDWIAENPTMETEKRPLGKLMKQERADLADGKFDDADSFMKDLQTKMAAPDGN